MSCSISITGSSYRGSLAVTETIDAEQDCTRRRIPMGVTGGHFYFGIVFFLQLVQLI